MRVFCVLRKGENIIFGGRGDLFFEPIYRRSLENKHKERGFEKGRLLPPQQQTGGGFYKNLPEMWNQRGAISSVSLTTPLQQVALKT
jgi:hypothetical protein